ncbi:SPOR domain-containing protein [Thermovibrio sp.]
MGEKKKLFPIAAYLKVNGERVRVLGVGTQGLVVEGDSNLFPEGAKLKVKFILPCDGYNEIVLSELPVECYPEEEGKVFCKFSGLSKEQEEFFTNLVRNYLWKRIISIPSEFMNYTQDATVREELLSVQRKVELKRRLKKLLIYGGAFALLIILALPLFMRFISPKERGLTVKYAESTTSNKESTKVKEFQTGTLQVKPQPSQTKKIQLQASQGQFQSSKTQELEVSQSKLHSQSQPQAQEKQVQTSKGQPQSPKAQEVQPQSPEIKPQPPVSKPTVVAVNKPSAGSSVNLSTQRDYYCIQVLSGTNLKDMKKLAEKMKGLPFVRVEKIGRAYTLRVGFWESVKGARELLPEVKKYSRSAFVRDCAYKPQRWVYPKESSP